MISLVLSPTFKCALISLGSLSGTSEHTSGFFPSIGSIDLLNSSSSIMTLVSIFSFSSPIFVLELRGAHCYVSREVYAHCALMAGRVHAPHAQTKQTTAGTQFTAPNKCGPTIRNILEIHLCLAVLISTNCLLKRNSKNVIRLLLLFPLYGMNLVKGFNYFSQGFPHILHIHSLVY